MCVCVFVFVFVFVFVCVCVFVFVCVCETYSFSVFNSIQFALFLIPHRPLKFLLLHILFLPYYTLMPLSPLLYSNVAAPLPFIAVLLHILLSGPPPFSCPSRLRVPSLWEP